MIKIALLSDIHFGKDSRTKDFAIPGQQIIDEAVGGQSLYAGLESTLIEYRPEYIFCAGDLTSTGKPLEYRHCLEKIYRLAEKCAVPKENVIYCMGNHDVDWQITDLSKQQGADPKEGPTGDDLVFAYRYYSELSHMWLHNAQFISDAKPYKDVFSKAGCVPLSGVIERDSINVYILNSGYLCTETSHGTISALQLKWLEGELAKEMDQNLWKIIMLHHHPFNYPYPLSGMDTSTLEEGPELQELCGKYGVHLVLHGHRHHPRAKTHNEDMWLNPVTFISAGSLSVNQNGRSSGQIPNTFHLLELEDVPGHLKLITYEYALGNGWTGVQYRRPTLPLNEVMYLGMAAIDDGAARELIRSFPKGIPISYDDIDNQLKYIPTAHLNELIKEIHAKDLTGDFPNPIMIHQHV